MAQLHFLQPLTQPLVDALLGRALDGFEAFPPLLSPGDIDDAAFRHAEVIGQGSIAATRAEGDVIGEGVVGDSLAHDAPLCSETSAKVAPSSSVACAPVACCQRATATSTYRASISIRKLRDHLRGLETNEWLRTHLGKGPGGVNVYQLNVGKISKASTTEKERIKNEKEQHRLILSEMPFASPDFQDTLPDSEDIPPDFQNIPQDFENTPPGPIGPTEPSGNRNESIVEPKKESSAHFQHFKEISPPRELTGDAKKFHKQRVRDWAVYEDDFPDFSERQRTSLDRALLAACTNLPLPELLSELFSWDFLESAKKEEWIERVEAQYQTVESPSVVQEC